MIEYSGQKQEMLYEWDAPRLGFTDDYVYWLEEQLREMELKYNRASNRANDEAGIVDRWRDVTGYPDPTTFRPELERLKAGKFTKEEIHNICHDLHGTVSAEEFAEGCRQEMIKLYGRCPFEEKTA